MISCGSYGDRMSGLPDSGKKPSLPWIRGPFSFPARLGSDFGLAICFLNIFFLPLFSHLHFFFIPVFL